MTEQVSEDVPVGVQYTQEELERAKIDLQTMTPEGYAEIVHYIKSLEEINLNAHGAFGAAKAKLYGSHGGVVELTSSRPNLKEAAEELFSVIGYIMQWQKGMKWAASPYSHLPEAPASPVTQTPLPVFDQPVTTGAPPEPEEEYVPVGSASPPPVTTGAAEPRFTRITVTALQHQVSTNGKHYLKVFGEPGFTVYGVNAWPEVIPIQGYENWSVGEKYNPPVREMTVAYISETMKNGKPSRKVSRFYAP